MEGCDSGGGSDNAAGIPDEQWPAQLAAPPHAVQQLLPVPPPRGEQQLVVWRQVAVRCSVEAVFILSSAEDRGCHHCSRCCGGCWRGPSHD